MFSEHIQIAKLWEMWDRFSSGSINWQFLILFWLHQIGVVWIVTCPVCNRFAWLGVLYKAFFYCNKIGANGVGAGFDYIRCYACNNYDLV